jgi:hypothetical protein
MTVGTIKRNLETSVEDLKERLDVSVRYGLGELEYQGELSEWIESLSKTILEMDKHVKQLKAEEQQ